jgi:hypothetical protein
MKNDTTWEYSNNSERNKQMKASSLGNLVGQRSKTPSPIPYTPSPLQGNFAPSQGKTSSLSINREAVLTLLTRKNYLVKQSVKLRDGPLDEKAWIYREANALTSVLDFIWLILKTVHYAQLEKLRNLQAIDDGLLPSTPDSAKIRVPGTLDAVRETLVAYSEWKQK